MTLSCRYARRRTAFGPLPACAVTLLRWRSAGGTTTAEEPLPCGSLAQVAGPLPPALVRVRPLGRCPRISHPDLVGGPRLPPPSRGRHVRARNQPVGEYRGRYPEVAAPIVQAASGLPPRAGWQVQHRTDHAAGRHRSCRSRGRHRGLPRRRPSRWPAPRTWRIAGICRSGSAAHR